MMFLKFIIALAVVSFTVGQHNLLAGRSGNGKSYIAGLMGCPSATCSGQDSCTKETKICSNGVIDAVGVDDNGSYTVKKPDGSTTTLSGLSYPLYNLLESLEKSKIKEFTLFEVMDANNIRRGTVEKSFFEFMEQVGCKSTTIMNKYRDEHKSKLKGNEIIVREGQTQAPVLSGPQCTLSAPSNWRDLLLRQDVAALQTAIHQEKCSAVTARRDEVQRALNDLRNTPDEGDDTNNCQYWGETGGRWCRGVKVFGKCSDWEPNRGWKTDHDCIRRRDSTNNDRRTRNQNKRNLIAEHEKSVQSHNQSRQELKCQ